MVPTCWTPEQALEQFQRLFFRPVPGTLPGLRAVPAPVRERSSSHPSLPRWTLNQFRASSSPLYRRPAPRGVLPLLFAPSGSPRRFTLLFAGPRRVARLFTLVSTVFSAPLLSSYRSIYLSISSAALPRRNQSPALPGRRRRRMRRQCRLRGRTSV